MNEITIFKNDEFGQVRTIGGDFVAADVARVLGYHDASAMTRTLDDDEKGMQIVQTPGGDQKLITVTESGLYHAIIKSRVPKAKTFRRWVTSEVLPAIRKTGSYGDLLAGNLKQLMSQFGEFIHSQQLVNQIMLETLQAIREGSVVKQHDYVHTGRTAGERLFVVEVRIVPAGVRRVTDLLDNQGIGYSVRSENCGSWRVLVIDHPVRYDIVDKIKDAIQGITAQSKWAKINVIQV